MSDDFKCLSIAYLGVLVQFLLGINRIYPYQNLMPQ